MKNIRLLAITNFWAFLIHLACSYFTQLNLINDVSVAEISHRFPSLFTPADITFAIWGLIYLLLFILCICHLGAAIFHSGNTTSGGTTRYSPKRPIH